MRTLSEAEIALVSGGTKPDIYSVIAILSPENGSGTIVDAGFSTHQSAQDDAKALKANPQVAQVKIVHN